MFYQAIKGVVLSSLRSRIGKDSQNENLPICRFLQPIGKYYETMRERYYFFLSVNLLDSPLSTFAMPRWLANSPFDVSTI